MPRPAALPDPVRRSLLPRRAAALVAAAAVLLVPAAAEAHVVAKAQPGGDGVTTVTFQFFHGCGSAPTESLRVQLPPGTSQVSADNPTGWTSEVAGQELRWTGGSVPNGATGTFVARMSIPGTAGETVFLPTLQGCPGGQEETWIARTADPEADDAAPRIVLTATVAPTTTAAPTTTTASAAPSTVPPPTTARPPGSATANPTATAEIAGGSTSSTSTTSSGSTGLVLGLVVAGLVVLGAVVAWVLTRRARPSGPDQPDQPDH